ncbi:MAG: aldehyde ferredoxin oxidoreductase [Anaerolinea sp.]|nr:aldehyde ferredoxin oxidoreductase [Anaerolinea sp.]
MQPIASINLTTRETGQFSVLAEWERDYLGGASLAARLLYTSLTRDLDPLSPQSPLLFLTGPLTGTAGPAVGRFVVCGKSPATGLWAESNCGGFWGPELRFAGFDGLWITGKAEGPVYLWINEGRLEVRDAAQIWGLDTYQAQAVLKNELNRPSARVAVIGPAGENGVLFAGIFCDHGRAAGRTGLGAVMGAKNLKAIAVEGSGKVPLADAEKYAPLRSAANRALKADNMSKVLHDLGTAGVANYAEYLGALPSKYYHAGAFPNVDKVSGSSMAETILTGTSACHACVIACGRVVRLEDGEKRKGPEYETIVGFGPNLLNDDLPAIVRLGEICDRYGMDTISAGNTLGLAFYLYEKGVITEKDTGFPLRWGDVAAAEKLLHLTARREGIGAYLAQGSRRFGAHFGAEDEAVQVNGLEVAYHDPRGVSGMALVYATSPRGACHNKSDYFFVDWGQAEASLGLEYFDKQVGAEKAANVARHQDWRAVCDALVLCLFSNIPVEMVVDLTNAATGSNRTSKDLLRAGERAWNLKRAINNRLGLTRANDKLPKALLKPLSEGGAAGYVPPLVEMLEAYYAVRGWDPGTGQPTRAKLESLGLGWAADDLDKVIR